MPSALTSGSNHGSRLLGMYRIDRGPGVKICRYSCLAALLRLVGLSKSALSKHVSALAEANVVSVASNPNDKRVRRLALTESGRKTFNAYLRRLENIVLMAKGLDG